MRKSFDGLSEKLAESRMHLIVPDETVLCTPGMPDSIGGFPLLPSDGAWPSCRLCSRRMVLFLQFRLREEFELPFRAGTHISVYMCPVHNEIPELFAHPQLPAEYWKQGGGHYAIFLADPGEAARHEEPHIVPQAVRFVSADERTRQVGDIVLGVQDLKVGGVPSWAQDPEHHTCSCGAEMAFVAQVPLDFAFQRRAAAPEQPDSFSREAYCLFLGNETYLFGCVKQCHPEAVLAVVQN